MPAGIESKTGYVAEQVIGAIALLNWMVHYIVMIHRVLIVATLHLDGLRSGIL